MRGTHCYPLLPSYPPTCLPSYPPKLPKPYADADDRAPSHRRHPRCFVQTVPLARVSTALRPTLGTKQARAVA